MVPKLIKWVQNNEAKAIGIGIAGCGLWALLEWAPKLGLW